MKNRHPVLWTAVAVIVLLAASPLLFLLIRGGVLLEGESVASIWRGDTWIAVLRTLSLGVGVAALCVGLALPLAWLTHSTDLPGRRWFRVLLNLPLAVPSYVSGFVVVATLGQSGWLHQALRPLGVESMPEIRGGLGATLALLYSYPFALITLQAALARTDPRQWEAARSLGQSPWGAFKRIVFPVLKPAMASGSLLVALYVVGDFGAVSLLRYKSLSYIIYLRQNSISDELRHEAIYLALLLTFLALGLVVLLRWLGGEVHGALSSQSEHRPWPIVPLGRWRWPAFALCSVVTFLGLGLPVLVVGVWLVRGVVLGRDVVLPLDETGMSLGLGVAAALLAVIVAVLPALLGRFAGEKTARLAGLVTHIGYALPGIVVALALLSMVTEYAFPLYQTVHLLLLAYLIRFLPLAVHTLDDALQGQNPRMYDAARSLGCSPPQAWWRVVLPNAKAAIWAGWLAVFIAVIKELPITLLLGPIDITLPLTEIDIPFRTLATRIWTLTEEEFFSEVAPVVLILLLLAGLGLLLRPDTEFRS